MRRTWRGAAICRAGAALLLLLRLPLIGRSAGHGCDRRSESAKNVRRGNGGIRNGCAALGYADAPKVKVVASSDVEENLWSAQEDARADAEGVVELLSDVLSDWQC